MKSFKAYISEAVATKRKKPTRKEKNDFAEKFDRVRDSNAYFDSQSRRYTTPWHLTGHNTTQHGTTKAIEAVKEKVFGKRRKGTSDLLWMHHKHGLITHPAVGDITHQDVQEKPRKGIRVSKKIQAKVTEGGTGAILGHGRIEHHEGGGGIISYFHRGVGSRAAVVRSIARQYPKYKIHDGFGHLLENWSYAHDFDDMPNSEKQKYVYHVTTAARARNIVKHGLKPRSPKGRTNYPGNKEHTQGQAFVTNHQGVRYWKDQTLHAVNRRKHEVDERDAENIHVIKFPIANLKKSTRRKLRMDPLGTKDARKRDDDPLIDPSSHEGSTALMIRKKIRESWSEKYKRSIDCSNPKGFSQKAHCQGRKKTNEKVEVKTFMRYLNEAKEETITDFVRFAARELGLQQEPNIEFLDVRDGEMTTAAYSPSDCSMKIYRGNRATFDICRSIAHEMVHQMQDENGDELDGTTGSPCEDEANALAGRLIRMYGSENDSFYEE